jgi:hypothetical protein
VVHVADRADVDMRLVPLEFLLCHFFLSRPKARLLHFGCYAKSKGTS